MTRRATQWYAALVLFSIFYLLYIPVQPDEAYYWNWSRHLAWSYYDGPPLLAYLIRLLRMLLGAHPFSLKCVGMLSVSVSTAIVYSLAKRMFDATIALRAMLIFWLMPVVTSVNIVTTLDAPLLMFWSLSLYCAWRWLESESLLWLYCTGVCIGLGLLSKYPMVLILPSFLLFLWTSDRARLRNKHVYIVVFLAVAIFTPVIYWNAQHHFASFLFQLHHGASHNGIQWGAFALFWAGLLLLMNPVFALLLCVGLWRFRHYRSKALGFLFWPFAFVIGFFAYNALYKHSEMNWVLPAYVSGAILLSYYISLMKRQWVWLLGVFLSLFFILVLLFPDFSTWLSPRAQLVGRFFGYRGLLQQITSTDIKPGSIILSNSYQNASEAAFYLQGQPEVYIVMPTRVSAYTEWSQPVLQRIQSGQVPSVYYLGDADKTAWLKQYFQYCEVKKVLRYQLPWVQRLWQLTYCHQPIKH